MRWDVRALVVAQLALVALVDDLVLFLDSQFRDIAVSSIDEVEERWKCRAKMQAKPAPVAQIEHSGQFRPQVLLIKVLRV
jgi:hypothetical protein